MTDKLFVVGLTGPTGSGKSEVAHVLAGRQIPVIDADFLARQVVTSGSKCLQKLVESFSNDILNDDGSLNRRQLAKRAFATPEDTALLNSITHPYIIELSKKILMQMEQTHEAAAVIDAPLLFESGMDSICDMTVAVIAPFDVRLQRILTRDPITEAQARSRMAAQKPDWYYTSRASVVVQSNCELEELRQKSERLADQIWELANEK